MKHTFLLFIILLLSLTNSFAQNPSSGNPDNPFATDEEAIKKIENNFCNIAWPKYKEIDNWIKTHKDNPEIPVPPSIDPPCFDCSSQGKTSDADKKTTEFINKVVQPEADMIKTLLEITRAWTMLGGNDNGYDSKVYESLPECMKRLSGKDMMEKVGWLVDRVYLKKVIPMAKKYNTFPEMEYAGVQCLLLVERQYALMNGGNDNSGGMMYVADWLENYAKKFNERLTKNYQYQIFPLFASLPRQLALIGSNLPNQMDLQKWFEEISS